MSGLVLSKSADWHARRAGKITGSKAGKIMTGGEAAFHLWEEMTGRREPDDLSDVLVVQMGTVLEPLICHWYTKQTGNAIIRRNEWIDDPEYDWRGCEIDGIIPALGAVCDAKFTLGFEPAETHFARYVPQLTHNAACTQMGRAALVTMTGRAEFRYPDFDIDPFYAAELLEREREFIDRVKADQPPGDWSPVEAPALPTEFHEADMDGSNAWAVFAGDWKANKGAAATFKKAEKELRALVERDVSRAFGAGIEIKRSKDNKLSIKEMK